MNNLTGDVAIAATPNIKNIEQIPFLGDQEKIRKIEQRDGLLSGVKEE